jgi:hypothetical protein
MGYHGRLHQRFMINKLVSLGGLNLVVQHEADTQVATADNLGGLVLGSPGIQYFIEAMQL